MERRAIHAKGIRSHDTRRPHPLRDLIQTRYPAANNLVAQFVAHGVLYEITGQKRNRRFNYRDYVDLFHDQPVGSTSP